MNNFQKMNGLIALMITAAGAAALSWEVQWQLRSTLALGVSAWGTALTLAVTMGGMGLGALIAGYWLRHRTPARPLRSYGILEILIGLSGLTLAPAFHAVDLLDRSVFAAMPEAAPLIHLAGMAAVLLVPTCCMGATLPFFGLIARQYRSSIAMLYGLNTLGAAAGTLLVAFFLIPYLGVSGAGWLVAAINFTVGILAYFLPPGEGDVATAQESSTPDEPVDGPEASKAWLIALATGFATFALEIAWFRSLTAAFRSTTDAFAIMLAAVLLALGLAARLAPHWRRKGVSLGRIMVMAGIAIFLATPLIERFDRVVHLIPPPYPMHWLLMTLLVIGPAILLLGAGLPWVLEMQKTPRAWARLYALNTLAAIAGAVLSAWLFLPMIGLAKTAWLAGWLVASVGYAAAPRQSYKLWVGSLGALLCAWAFESGAGRTYIQGNFMFPNHKILEFYEGPEATIAAVEYDNKARALVIDGFLAAAQFDKAHYMAWMGHLPMLLHPDPKQALVICFGTGQTANAVRQENPQALDIVDVNPRVFKLAHNFAANKNVLGDPRVTPIAMDGRAWLRRTTKHYDVITLEPMPPNFAGVNALYSQEFYFLARARLNPGGTIAQWVTFWLDTPEDNASIAKTFQSVFPNAILWVDPISQTGIIVGSTDDNADLTASWPGLARIAPRDLAPEAIRAAVQLDRAGVRRYGEEGHIITDDNQLLAYGKTPYAARFVNNLNALNLQYLDLIKQDKP